MAAGGRADAGDPAGFLALWASTAPEGADLARGHPGPAQVWEQAGVLHADAMAEGEKEAEFYAKQAEKNAALVAEGKADEVKDRTYTGKPTYYAQISGHRSRQCSSGSLLATLVAVPLGILSGMSPTANAAINPLVQIFKPVSPLAWLPIVTMVVSALYAGGGIAEKLCHLGGDGDAVFAVADADQHRAGGGQHRQGPGERGPRVLKLSTWTKITRLVLPSALPLIFTGLRLSLGVGWMVLIAAEMLAQNPGLGKFVWDEFQNGSEQSWRGSWSRC